MKKPFLKYFIIFYFISNTVHAQSPNWLWEKGQNEAGNSGNAVCTDANGNVYTAGYFSKTAATVKYDASGNLIWVENPKGSGSTTPTGIATDPGGNIYVTGSFGDTAIFGGNVLISSGGDNSFIVKYDPSGNVVWTTSITGTSGNDAFGISTDTNSNVYIIGGYGGDITVGQIILAGSGSFIIKYDSTGKVQWAKSAPSSDNGLSMHTDPSGNSLIIYSLNVGGGNGSSVAITKYDNAGNIAWTTGGEAPNNAYANDYGNGITTDLNGNVYAVGQFSDSIAFGNYTLPCSCPYTDGIFIVKLDPSGNVLWLEGAGSSNADIFVWGDAVDNKGNVAIVGDFYASTLTFDTITISPTGNTLYVFEFNPSGNALWAATVSNAGGINDDDRISADTFGNIYVTGVGGNPVFGTNTLSYSGIFLAKLGYGFPAAIPSEGNIENDIKVFPNPTGGEVYFEGMKSGYTVQIYDVLGRMLSILPVEADTYSVDMNATGKGVYLYKIMDGMLFVQQGKIIVE